MILNKRDKFKPFRIIPKIPFHFPFYNKNNPTPYLFFTTHPHFFQRNKTYPTTKNYFKIQNLGSPFIFFFIPPILLLLFKFLQLCFLSTTLLTFFNTSILGGGRLRRVPSAFQGRHSRGRRSTVAGLTSQRSFEQLQFRSVGQIRHGWLVELVP